MARTSPQAAARSYHMIACSMSRSTPSPKSYATPRLNIASTPACAVSVICSMLSLTVADSSAASPPSSFIALLGGSASDAPHTGRSIARISAQAHIQIRLFINVSSHFFFCSDAATAPTDWYQCITKSFSLQGCFLGPTHGCGAIVNSLRSPVFPLDAARALC